MVVGVAGRLQVHGRRCTRLVEVGIRRGLLVVLAVGLVLGGCSRSSPSGTSGRSPTEPTTSPESEEPPVSESPSATENDTDDIRAAIEAYLEAFANNDYEGRRSLSVGDIHVLADWQPVLDQGFLGAPGLLDCRGFELLSVDGERAVVRIEASIRFDDALGNPYTRDFTGPAELARSGGGWKVSDYTREGRSERDTIFTKFEGATAQKNGVTLKVRGVNLRSNATVFIVDVINNTSSNVAGNYIPSFVDGNGRQHGNGEPSSDAGRIAPGVTFQMFYYFSEAVPENTTSLRLLPKLVIDEPLTILEFDIALTLIE